MGRLSCIAYAQNIGSVQVPKPVFDKFREAYPNAKDVQTEKVTHFGVPLFKLAFKQDDQQELEYYRESGAILNKTQE